MAEIEKIEEKETLEEEKETLENQDKEEYTWEEVMEMKKKAERLEKAEKKLVELKKANKSITKDNSTINSREELEKFYAEKKFYENNPDAEAYKDKMAEYKDLSLDDAYLLASREDKEIEKNREIYGKSFVKGEPNNESLPTVSVDTFDNMTSKGQEDYTKKMTEKYGKVRFK